MRPAATIDTVTAGLMWQPEIGPIAYAIAVTARPKAKALGRRPPGAALTQPPIATDPQPISTRTAVPIASARYFLSASLIVSPVLLPPRFGMIHRGSWRTPITALNYPLPLGKGGVASRS